MLLTIPLPAPPHGPQDVLRRVLAEHGDRAGVVLACYEGPTSRSAVLIRIGPGDDRALTRLARELGPYLLDVLVVAEGRWRSLLCRDPACCPPAGRRLPETSPAVPLTP